MSQTSGISHYIKQDGKPTPNLTALMQIAVNTGSSENMKKACALSFRELGELIHTRTSESKKRKFEPPKQTNKECVETHAIYDLPACSSESDSESDQGIDVELHQASADKNTGTGAFFKDGKFK